MGYAIERANSIETPKRIAIEDQWAAFIVTHDGVPSFFKSFPTRAEARAWLKEWRKKTPSDSLKRLKNYIGRLYQGH